MLTTIHSSFATHKWEDNAFQCTRVNATCIDNNAHVNQTKTQ